MQYCIGGGAWNTILPIYYFFLLKVTCGFNPPRPRGHSHKVTNCPQTNWLKITSSSSSGWVCFLQIWRFSQTLCVCEPQVEFIRVLFIIFTIYLQNIYKHILRGSTISHGFQPSVVDWRLLQMALLQCFWAGHSNPSLF